MSRPKGSKNKEKLCESVNEKPIVPPIPDIPKPKGRGVVIIALGNPQYGRMAANLAASIRYKDKETAIHLVHQGDALNHLTDAHKELFTTFAECPIEYYTKNGNEVYLKAKTCLYELSPFAESIFLDADMIWFPTKSISDLFDQLKDTDFTFQNRGHCNLSDEKLNPKFCMWCDVNEVKSAYETTGRFYQLASEFIYFKRTEANEKYFKLVREIFDNPKVKPAEFGGDIPDELAFDIASCVLAHYPHKENFVIVYWALADKQMSWTDVMRNYWGYSIGGNVIPETILQRYNQLALAHAKGLSLPYHYKAYNKKQWNKQRQKI